MSCLLQHQLSGISPPFPVSPIPILALVRPHQMPLPHKAFPITQLNVNPESSG